LRFLFWRFSISTLAQLVLSIERRGFVPK
jgi:hypothetical protein